MSKLTKLSAVSLVLVVAVACSDGLTEPVYPDLPSFAHVPGMATGRAQMHPFGQSGIRGVITFTDDGAHSLLPVPPAVWIRPLRTGH